VAPLEIAASSTTTTRAELDDDWIDNPLDISSSGSAVDGDDDPTQASEKTASQVNKEPIEPMARLVSSRGRVIRRKLFQGFVL